MNPQHNTEFPVNGCDSDAEKKKSLDRKKNKTSIIFYQKLTFNLKPHSGKKRFCFSLRGDPYDPTTTFSQHRCAWPTSCVFHCWLSHTKPDIHTPTVTAQCDPVILQGWEEFLFASVPQLSRRVRPLGQRWVKRRPKRGGGARRKVTEGWGWKCLVCSWPVHEVSWCMCRGESPGTGWPSLITTDWFYAGTVTFSNIKRHYVWEQFSANWKLIKKLQLQNEGVLLRCAAMLEISHLTRRLNKDSKSSSC